jgi:ribonuclease-3
MGTELGELESRLGYTFADKQLLLRALTHKSYLADHPASALPSDNEQFEFLGDSILGFCASDYLLRLKPSEPEGKLSRLKSHLVSAAYLH